MQGLVLVHSGNQSMAGERFRWLPPPSTVGTVEWRNQTLEMGSAGGPEYSIWTLGLLTGSSTKVHLRRPES